METFCIRQTAVATTRIAGAPWSVFVLGTENALTSEEAKERAPELAIVCSHLNAEYPPTREDRRDVGLVASKDIRERQLKVDGKWVPSANRDIELASGLGTGGVVTGHSIPSGQRAAPSLARWAHTFNGTNWENKPTPPAPPKLTPEQQKQHDTDMALVRVAQGMFRVLRPTESEVCYARLMIKGIQEFLALQRAN